MQLSVEVKRFGYRLAWRVLRLHWRFVRPGPRGVKCLITDGDQVLLVRHSYGSRQWDLPGGHGRRGEDPVTTAQREMQEELGIGEVEWSDHGVLHRRLYRRLDQIRVVHAEVSHPALHVDPVEIEAVAWFERGRLPLWVSPAVGAVLGNDSVS